MRNIYAENVIHCFIDLLKETREAKNISHEKLGEKAGVHRSTIGLIENKKRNPTILSCYKICMALEISMPDLIKQAEVMASNFEGKTNC